MSKTISINKNNANKKTLFLIFSFAFIMLGVSYAAVPMYEIFCKVTGFGGTTQKVDDYKESKRIFSKKINVRFDSNVNPNLPWKFTPEISKVKLFPGKEIKINYIAENISNNETIGTSTFNVTPHKAGQYFMKLECFCFTEQKLMPGEKIIMPVNFYLDEEILENKNTLDIDEIVLSYTFFPLSKN